MKTKSILFCLLFAIAANSFIPVKAQINVTDSLALVDLYNSTDGPHWVHKRNWLTTAPVSTWYGVFPNGTTRVQTLYMNNNNLHGAIPVSFGNLTGLTTILLYHNHLNGALPSSIGNLVNLTEIRFDQNQLSGAIPSSIGNLVNLTELILNNNKLQGTIPASIGNLVKMVELHLNDNQLHGTIPSSIGNLKKINILNLSYNQLHGQIPGTLGNLTKAFDIRLNNNDLSGAIPASLSKIKNVYLDLSYNQLSQLEGVHSSKDSGNIYGYISHNLLTFDGLQVIAKYYPSITYAPQDTILPVHQSGNVLSVSAGGTLSNNTYRWHQAGVAEFTTINADSTFTPLQSGMYYVIASNNVANKLKLHSDTINFVMPVAKQSSNVLIAKAMQPATVASHMLVYPNPASSFIHIQTNGVAVITLTNSNGKILLTKTINNNAVIPVGAFAGGTYYIQNKTSGATEKIIIAH